MKIDKRKVMILMIGAIVVILALFGVIKGVEVITAKKIDTSEGLAIIQKQEDMDVKDTEKKIKRMEEKEQASQEEKANRTTKEIFVNSVVMGDSISQGFTDFDIMDSANVIAERGIQLTQLDDAVSTVEKMNPETIFLAYGMNDVIVYGADTGTFKEKYAGLIDKLQKDLPDTRIFVNAIFPVQQVEIDNNPEFKNLAEYNEVLKTLCDERQLSFIDNSDIATADYYEEDGVHFKADFYPIWAARMAEVASL